MKSNLLAVLLAAGGLLLISFPAVAHHAQSVYDLRSDLVLDATVTSFELVNPHSLIHFQAKDEKGQMIDWTAEGAPPNNLRRLGWTKYTLKPGDHVTLTVHQAKNGTKEVLLQKVTLNGKDIFVNNRGDNP